MALSSGTITGNYIDPEYHGYKYHCAGGTSLGGKGAGVCVFERVRLRAHDLAPALHLALAPALALTLALAGARCVRLLRHWPARSLGRDGVWVPHTLLSSVAVARRPHPGPCRPDAPEARSPESPGNLGRCPTQVV